MQMTLGPCGRKRTAEIPTQHVATEPHIQGTSRIPHAGDSPVSLPMRVIRVARHVCSRIGHQTDAGRNSLIAATNTLKLQGRIQKQVKVFQENL